MATRKTKSKPKVNAKPYVKPKPKANAKAMPKAQAKPKAKVKPKPKIGAKSKISAEHDLALRELAAIDHKIEQLGVAALTEAERDVYVLSDLHFRVARGALSGFLESAFDLEREGARRGREIVVATQALRRAGQARYATLLDCALRIFLRPAPSGAIGWLDLIASIDPEEELNALDSEAFEINDALWEVMMKAAASLPGAR